MNIPRIVDGEYVTGFLIRLQFDDGTVGTVNLAGELYGLIFEPLRDPEYFRPFRVHPELHTLTWDNGADFSAELFYQQARQQAA